MSETINMVLDVPKQFYKDSVQLLNRCSKPDKKGTASHSIPLTISHFRSRLEFIKITQAISVGFVIMGVIGYTIKLVHIPINNIIVYVA